MLNADWYKLKEALKRAPSFPVCSLSEGCRMSVQVLGTANIPTVWIGEDPFPAKHVKFMSLAWLPSVLKRLEKTSKNTMEGRALEYVRRVWTDGPASG